MSKVVVDIVGHAPYEVRVAPGAIAKLGTALRALDTNPQALIITDSEVASRYLDPLRSSLEAADYHCSVITVASGEEAKSIACAAEIWNAMAECKLNRDSLVVALGGGVVGDLAGFTGSTFMRGLPIVQVPTTLLSMVDSSVGGKTAINLDAGKNLVGTFAQPLFVCADIDTLVTLPEREWACGCAEIAKSALIDSDDFFFWLCAHAQELADRDMHVTQEAVVRSIVFKAQVVAADEQETKGVRECLNYGHTLAHAIETCAGYGHFSHGAAVAEGMRFAARLAAAHLGTSIDLVRSQDELLDTLGLPALDFHADPDRLLELMFSDKKVRSNTLRFVLPRDVGEWEVTTLDPDFVLDHLVAWQQSLD
jgi:3-dehydroquinate synthase